MSAEQAISFPPELNTLVGTYSLAWIKLLEKLYVLGRDVDARGIPGDFVECGVWNGGTAAAVLRSLRGTGRRGWLYDSFEGLPPTTPLDGEEAAKYVGACVGSVDKVKEAMKIVGIPETDFVIRKGWFDQTFALPLPKQVAFLHVDCDWYDSVLLTLKTFYPLIPEGGIILLDDFGHWEGCREAFYDFVASIKEKPLLERFGHTQAFWVKGRTHNRDFNGKWEIP